MILSNGVTWCSCSKMSTVRNALVVTQMFAFHTLSDVVSFLNAVEPIRSMNMGRSRLNLFVRGAKAARPFLGTPRACTAFDRSLSLPS